MPESNEKPESVSSLPAKLEPSESGTCEVQVEPSTHTKATGQVPFNRETLRSELFVRAGVTPDVMGGLLKKAVAELDHQLEAVETKFFAHEGEVQDEREVEDNAARLAAIRETFALTDAVRGKQEGGGTAPQKLVLVFPVWAQKPPQPAIDVTAEVVRQ